MRRSRAARAIRAAAFAACLAAAGCSSAIDPQVIEDAQAAARVRTALVNDADLGSRPIEVRVARGVAVLSGRVRSQAEADRAAALARSVMGVLEVQVNLQIGADAAPPPAEEPSPGRVFSEPLLSDVEPSRGLLAVGASMGWSSPRADGLQSRLSVGPSVRLGSGRGLGPAVGFDWMSTDVRALEGRPAGVTRVRIRPVMVGAGYTRIAGRLSVAPSVVGGYAFNSITIRDVAAGAPLPVEVGDSFAWRAGVSLWVETGRRAALNVSAGYLDTTLRFTVLEQGRLVKRSQRGDAVIVRAGAVYKLF